MWILQGIQAQAAGGRMCLMLLLKVNYGFCRRRARHMSWLQLQCARSLRAYGQVCTLGLNLRPQTRRRLNQTWQEPGILRAELTFACTSHFENGLEMSSMGCYNVQQLSIAVLTWPSIACSQESSASNQEACTLLHEVQL
jgi:hypothetical protein